ncbi:MAG: thioredoxin family protein, partial [Pseudomonadota bacterium]
MGLKAAIEEVSASHVGASDEEIARALLDRLEKKNYIPRSARDDYGRAFVREFRLSLGMPVAESAPKELSIMVLRPACCVTDRLEQSVMQVLAETGIPAAVEHVSDIDEIAKFGSISPPALVINGRVTAMGSFPSTKKIKEWLTEAAACNQSTHEQ